MEFLSNDFQGAPWTIQAAQAKGVASGNGARALQVDLAQA